MRGGGCRGNDAAIFNLLKSKKTDQAYVQAGNAVIENPACWKMHRALAHVLLAQHRPQFAVMHLGRALDSFRVNNGRPGGFIPVLITEYGRALMQDGRLKQAKAQFEKALAIEPVYLPAKAALADVTERATARGARGFNGHKLLDQGHEFERAGRYAEAWQCFLQAKADLQAKGFKYNRAPVVRRFDAYRSHCTAAAMRRLDEIARANTRGTLDNAIHDSGSWSPIFVLGYPRSGTTLLEQMLCGSPDIAAGGEFPYIVELVNAAKRFIQSAKPYPFCLDELELADTAIALENMRQHYLARAIERMGRAARPFLTDKMPLNECYLPFVHLLFPHSPKILIRRNPLDVVVSNFSLFLTHGSHQADSPASCFDHIGLVDSLVAHYRRKMAGIPLNLVEIAYEDLVTAPETSLKRICGAVGLEFSPAMLEPEKLDRYAHTASYAQVREKISTKNIGRWRNFAEQLRQALPAGVVP